MMPCVTHGSGGKRVADCRQEITKTQGCDHFVNKMKIPIFRFVIPYDIPRYDTSTYLVRIHLLPRTSTVRGGAFANFKTAPVSAADPYHVPGV